MSAPGWQAAEADFLGGAPDTCPEDVVERLTAERDALLAEVERLTPKCDAGCRYDDGPLEDCSLHGRPVAEVWDIVAKVAAQRDALAAQIAALPALGGAR